MKKLLLILLCLPMIGFGQNEGLDTLVFSDGKIVTAIVIEVGVDEVKYRFKNENNTNIIQTKILAQIKFSSGRTQTFKGNQKLKFEEELKIKLEKKKEKRKNKRKNFKSSLEIGTIAGLTLNKTRGTIKDFWEKQGHITVAGGASIQYNLSPLVSINSKVLYHIKGFKLNANTTFTDNSGTVIGQEVFLHSYDYHYIAFPLSIQCNYGTDFQGFLNTGLYLSYLLKVIESIEHPAMTLSGGLHVPANSFPDENKDLEPYSRLDAGFSIGGGVSYQINYKLRVFFEGSMYLGLINTNKKSSLKNANNLSNYHDSYNLLLGCSYNLSKN